MSPNRKRILVLTALTRPGGCHGFLYRRFAGSLFDTGFDGTVVIMVTGRDFTDLALGGLRDQYPGLAFHIIPEPQHEGDINCCRYLHYQEFLDSFRNGEDYDYIMLSDSRDVFFQRDISGYAFDDGVDLFLAEEEKVIGDCVMNSGWILDLFGRSTLDELRERIVLCSGTTIGRPAAVRKYLSLMGAHVRAVEDEFRRRFGHLGGIDQGIHNYLYYTDRLTDLRIQTMNNDRSLFYTIGHVAKDDPDRRFLDESARFVNRTGEVCYCIHQFDRLDDSILKKSSLRQWNP